MAQQHHWITAKCYLAEQTTEKKGKFQCHFLTQPYFSQLPACEQTVWHDWPPLGERWSWLEGSPSLLWQKCYGNGKKVCTVAIAQQEWIAYYPPLCIGSNGEREGILSVMVMMHFEWVVPIIYQWMIMAGESILWVIVTMPRKWQKGLCRIYRVCCWGFMVIDWMKGMAGFFSLSVVIMVGQPMCSRSVNIQGRDSEECVCTWLHVCVLVWQTRATQ